MLARRPPERLFNTKGGLPLSFKLLFPNACFLVLVTLIFCANATAQDMSVFGMRFGQSLSIPECPTEGYSIDYELFPNHVCYARLMIYERFGAEVFKRYDKKHPPPTLPPLGTEEVRISYPILDRPEISNTTVAAILIDGRLEGISFGTRGIADADSILEKLKAKYGASPTIVSAKVQNRLGASFNTFYALWIFPDLRVGFHSVSDTLDAGLVIIDTKKGNEWREQRLKETSKDKRPL
jgi:hypothetical protein